MIPPDTKLTPRPAELPAWDSLNADQKRLYAREMEVFAGFLTQTDEQLGRILDEVANSPQGKNTLIMMALGDNGCSAEGGLDGTLNNMATQNGFPDDVQTMLKSVDGEMPTATPVASVRTQSMRGNRNTKNRFQHRNGKAIRLSTNQYLPGAFRKWNE